MLAMHYLVPAILILGFSSVLTVGLLSVMQDLMERTSESPLIRESEASLVQMLDDGTARDRRTQPGRSPYGRGSVAFSE